MLHSTTLIFNIKLKHGTLTKYLFRLVTTHKILGFKPSIEIDPVRFELIDKKYLQCQDL